MWSGPKTRGLHHTIPLQTMDRVFNTWYELSDFSDVLVAALKLLYVLLVI